MMPRCRTALSLAGSSLAGLLVSLFAIVARGQPAELPPSVRALQSEIARTAELRLPGAPRAHYAAATLFDESELVIHATLGAVVISDRDRWRTVKVEVRVGQPALDSGGFISDGEAPRVLEDAPLHDSRGDGDALRRVVWLAADRAFKNACAVYEAKRAYREGKAEEVARLPDFGPAPAERGSTPALPEAYEQRPWLLLARRLSQAFVAYPEIHVSSVRITLRNRIQWFVDTAGTVVSEPSSLARVEIVGQTQADDGMVLVDHAVVSAPSATELPLAALEASARRVAEHLTRLRVAPVVDDYAGPVLFEGEAAPQILRFLLADELSGTPPLEPSGDAELSPPSELLPRVGRRVLPLGFVVVDDPTIDRYGSLPLIGGYRYDDEGVRGQRISLVEDGTLRTLLGSRTPSEVVPVSNGHGRAGVMTEARGRASNLLILPPRAVPAAALRRRLLEAVRKEGLDHALIVTRLDDPAVTGSQDDESRGPAEASQFPAPVALYRIHHSGEVELVRGGAIKALRTRDLRHILAAGAPLSVTSYFAPSGPFRTPGSFEGEIPTSIVAPPLLFPDLDVSKPALPHPKPPIAPPPAP